MTVSPEALLAGFPGPMIDIAERLRAIVRRAVPDAIETVRPGWRLIGYDLPAGRRTAFFAWVAAEPGHVHLGFPLGVLLADPAEVLAGVGVTKRARWFTVRAGDLIPRTLYAGFVREAARVARLSSSERAAILFDREARYLPGDHEVSKSKLR